MTRFQADVTKELREMKRVGMHVPAKAFELAKDAVEMTKTEEEGLGVTETADLLVDLAGMR